MAAAEAQRQHAGGGPAAAAATDDDKSQSGGGGGARALPQPSSSDGDLPLLVFHRFKEDMSTFSVSSQILHKNMERYGFLRRRENLYWSTPQGWMLITEYPDEPYTSSSAAYLWNPSTGEKLPLPNIPEGHDVVLGSRCLLTHKDPAHPGCVVVLLLLKDGLVPHMWFCHVAGGRWRCFPYQIPSNLGPEAIELMGFELRRWITTVTACRGKLYFTNTSESMGVIDFASTSANDDDDDHQHFPVFQYLDVPDISHPNGTTSSGSWLVESHDDQLLRINTCHAWMAGSNLLIAVNAYKMDFSAQAWRKVHDIGDAVVFLDSSRNVATCRAASPLGLKVNQVYFISYNDASLCSFDLGLDAVENIWAAPRSLWKWDNRPFWIVPPSS